MLRKPQQLRRPRNVRSVQEHRSEGVGAGARSLLLQVVESGLSVDVCAACDDYFAVDCKGFIVRQLQWHKVLQFSSHHRKALEQ
jgi:hypothetical protein